MSSEKYIDLFSRDGMNEFVNEEMHEEIKRFLCHLYGKNSTSCLNEFRYQIYRQRGGKIPCGILLPCEDVLRLHSNRANYQARVWRSSLDPYIAPSSLIGHGWELDDEGSIDIDWMNCNPASEKVRGFFSISSKFHKPII